MDTIDLILYGVLGFLVILISIIGIYFLYVMSQYKHTFIRKIITGGKTLIEIDKAREIEEKKTGNIYWKLLKAKHKITRPPNEVITPTTKGKFSVEAYYSGDINYIHEKPIDTNKLMDDYYRFQEHLTVVPAGEPITTNQRQNAYSEIEKAFNRKHKGIGALVLPIVVISALVIMISVMFIFGADLIKPIIELNQKNIEITGKMGNMIDQLTQTSNLLVSVIEERQYISAQNQGTINLINQTIPN